MFVLGSLIANLVLAVSLILAAAVAGLMAYHYAKARILERKGYVYDPDTQTVEADQAGMEQRAKSAEEIAQIRERIEALMEQQQMSSETQNQHLGQKLDEIRTHMGQQDVKMDGLKSELRHEIRHRDSELGELRQELAAALDSFWKSMPALSAGNGPNTVRALPQAATPEDATPATAASVESAFAPTAKEPTTFAPVPDPVAAATMHREPPAFVPFETEPVRFEPVEPEPATFAPIESGPETFAPIEPEPATFVPIEAEASTFAQVELEPAVLVPEPATSTLIEPEPVVLAPEPVSFAPIEPEPATFAQVEPELVAPVPFVPFVPIEPEPAAFSPVEPEPVALSPEPASFAPIEVSFAPIEPETAAFALIEPEPATFVSIEAEPEAFAPGEAEPVWFELAESVEIPADFDTQPDLAALAQIPAEPGIEPAAATFTPITFNTVDDQTEPEPEKAVGFSQDAAPSPADESVHEAPTFAAIQFAPVAGQTSPEVEHSAKPAAAPAEPRRPVFAPVEPASAVFTPVAPMAETSVRADAGIEGGESSVPTMDYQTPAQTLADPADMQPQAPNTAPEANEDVVWTNASAWADQPPVDSHADPAESGETTESQEKPVWAAVQAPRFASQVVNSPSGDSISARPNQNFNTRPPAAPQAPPSRSDAGSPRAGEPTEDSPEPMSPTKTVAIRMLVPEQIPQSETASKPENEPRREDRPPAASEGASANPIVDRDDFTVITSITEEIQQRLYHIGVNKLDEMARWSRADARRVSGRVDVSEETIMHQWIFEAQSVLFDSFQDRMARQTAAGQTP